MSSSRKIARKVPKVLRPGSFPGVRLIPERPDKTRPHNARAVTVGQEIYFHPGQYRPGTLEGDALIAHELVHTMQTRAGEISPQLSVTSVTALERNAEAIRSRDGVAVLPAAVHVPLCSPFDNETAEEQSRRERLIQSIVNASQNILLLLQTGGLVQGSEVAQEHNGIRGVSYYPGSPTAVFESLAERETRLRRILHSLMAMARQYRSSPIPADYGPPTSQPPEAGGGYQSALVRSRDASRPGTFQFCGGSAAYADLQGAYTYGNVSQGLVEDVWMHDWLFLDPSVRVIPGALRAVRRARSGIATGINIVVPDIDHEPLHYWRLFGSSPIPEGATIVELWNDEFGHYYMHRGQRIDVPYRDLIPPRGR